MLEPSLWKFISFSMANFRKDFFEIFEKRLLVLIIVSVILSRFFDVVPVEPISQYIVCSELHSPTFVELCV